MKFRQQVDAIRAPLAFLREHPERAERMEGAADALRSAFGVLRTLAIPPAARERAGEVLGEMGEGELDAETAARIEQRLGGLLRPEYPERVLEQTTERLSGVGPKVAASLARRELSTVEDLLFFLPRSYDDRRDLRTIAELRVGHPACFEASVTRSSTLRMRNGRTVFRAVVSDDTGAIELKWFRGINHFEDRVKPGRRLLVAGDVRRYRYSKEIHHPDIETLGDDASAQALPRIVPVYPTVEGVPPRTVRRIVHAALAYAGDLAPQHLPEGVAASLGLSSVIDALRQVHEPGPHLDPDELRERRTTYHLRLIAEELFLLQAGLALRRTERSKIRTRPLASGDSSVGEAIAALPFTLTSDQTQAWSEIAADLARPQPMNRLLIGDVGTGKTVIAYLGAVAARASQGLTAVLAPTEILAEQHERTFRALAKPHGPRVALLTGSTPAPERRSLRRLLRLGEIDVVIGTHALIADSVEMERLRFVVIDEQHRFGVEQRRALGRKGDDPHVLVMTATPIPRTLALTAFGDLDQSVLRERPAGRPPVSTRVVPDAEGRRVFEALEATLARKEQAFVVYPLVEESEKQDLRDATRGYERLRAALSDYRVALVHGRLDARERSATMTAFARGEMDVLVSTTVIEVGVDVARATLLIVQHAERFGLAQLHQLRGRVGRGDRPGVAILMADPKSEDAYRRLAILEASASGFDVAEEDLRIRGAGEWLGTRQAGHLPELRLADLVRHAELLPPVQIAARDLCEADPGLAAHAALRAAIERRWGRRLEFGVVA